MNENKLNDMIDKITMKSCHDIQQVLSRPQMFKNTLGKDIFGYPSEQLGRAGIYYNSYCKNMEYEKASDLLEEIKTSITIQELALAYKKAFVKNIESVDFLKGKYTLMDIFITLCSKYLNVSEEVVKKTIENSDQIYSDNWCKIVTDEDNVTPEQLYKFYNSIKFPVGSLFPHLLNSDLAIAYRALPILVINSNNFKNIFDFGGNSGETIAAISNNCDIDSCYLIEENEDALSFAKWRNDIFEVQNVNYIKESYLDKNIEKLENKFDFGICTEVLEHVYYVEETVEKISRLLKTGGALYFSASFGYYPTPSHLKKNIKYYGKEDQLMYKYGLSRIELDFPIPLLSDIRIYVKQ